MNAALLQHIELLIGSIGVILGFFFAALLLSNRKKQHLSNVFLAIYLLAFSLRIGKSLFHNYFEINATIRTLFLTTLLGVGPSIWLHTSYLLQAKSKPTAKGWLHYLPFILLAGCCWLIPNDGSWIFGVFYKFTIVHMFVYTLFSLLQLNRTRKIGQLPTKPNVTHWLYHFLTINLLFIGLYFLISELIFTFYIGISFLFSSVIIYLSFMAFRYPSIFKVEGERYSQSSLNDQDIIGIMKLLRQGMEQEKPYLDPSLTLSKLSAQVGVSSKVLSQVINQQEGLNYSQYISKYRVEEVKRLMSLPQYSNMTIAAMAYDSGFSSISTFNSAFKRYAGITAKAYRKGLESNKS